MANRVLDVAKKNQATIDAGGLDGALDSPDKLKVFDELQAVTFSESAKYRSLNADAYCRDIITLDEANTVFNALGREGFPQGNGGWSKGTGTGLKCAITILMGQLLGVRA